MPEKWVLRQYQALPLIAKIRMSQARIREWYDHFQGSVFISFSGGKDSTALAHVVHECYPDVPLVFCNTGLEYPEVRQFAERMGAETVYPKMSFAEVISTYGYPIISKENAEAIHYARKIIPHIEVGGVQTHSGKAAGISIRTILWKRLELNGNRNQVGGGMSQFQGRTGWRRATLNGCLPEKPTGDSGEEEPSPG